MIAAIYTRKSSEQTGLADDEKSVARQIEHGRAYAERRGWDVDERSIFVDDGISGAEFANRPGYVRLLNALKPKPRFQVLIVSDLDRLGRESIETSMAVKHLNMAGVRVFAYLTDLEIRLDSPIDALIVQVQAFGAAIERQKAGQRTYDALVRKAKSGHVTGGQCFGYDNVRVNGHVERRINEQEAAVIRRIFELCAAGQGQIAIAHRLNEERAIARERSRGGRWRGHRAPFGKSSAVRSTVASSSTTSRRSATPGDR